MSDYDPAKHKIDVDAWTQQKNAGGAQVEIDRWTKDGQNFVFLAYWAYKGKRRQDEYRVRIVASTLEEAIYRAEQKEGQRIMTDLFGECS